MFPCVLITAGEYEGGVDSIQRTTAGIAEEVKDATVFIFSGGAHEDFIGAFASGEGGTGDDYMLVGVVLSASLKLGENRASYVCLPLECHGDSLVH